MEYNAVGIEELITLITRLEGEGKEIQPSKCLRMGDIYVISVKGDGQETPVGDTTPVEDGSEEEDKGEEQDSEPLDDLTGKLESVLDEGTKADIVKAFEEAGIELDSSLNKPDLREQGFIKIGELRGE